MSHPDSKQRMHERQLKAHGKRKFGSMESSNLGPGRRYHLPTYRLKSPSTIEKQSSFPSFWTT
jgi:hypothetical protein